VLDNDRFHKPISRSV